MLLVHAFFHRSAINSLTYAARCAPSIVDFGSSPSVPIAPVYDYMQGGGDATWFGPTLSPSEAAAAQAGWWWRKNAAQAA